LLAPNGFYVARNELRRRRSAALREATMQHGAAALARSRQASHSVDEAVRFLVARGLDEQHVRDGSMPQAALDFAAAIVREHVPAGEPTRALQIGNFVGVSLSYVSATLRALHPDSVVVSIDPNITHRAIADPQSHVLALLGHFDLLRNNAVITGYSLEQNLGDDPTLDPLAHLVSEQACERVLENLATVTGERFQLVLLDGNHEAEYLAREMIALRGLLAPGAVLVIDDVEVGAWDAVVEVFERVAAEEDEFEELGRNGRVGVLRFKAATGPSPKPPAS